MGITSSINGGNSKPNAPNVKKFEKFKACLFKWSKRVVTALILIFIIIVGLVCLKGFVVSINSFITNQQAFNKVYSDTAAKIAKLSPKDKEAAQISIDHLQQLQQIQKNAASSDVMSFLYSMLSTVLVGLCAGFAAKSFKDSAKAKKAVHEARINARKAKSSADMAQENADASKLKADETINVVNDIDSAVLKLSSSLDLIKSNMSKTVENAINIMNIHIEIVQAKAYLTSFDKINSNQRISNVSRSILSLTADNDFKAIHQLLLEVLSLESQIETFEKHAKLLPDGNNKISIYQAITRYQNELSDAANHCEKLKREIRSKPREI